MHSTGKVNNPASPKKINRSFQLVKETSLQRNDFPDFGNDIGVMPIKTTNKLIDAAILVSKSDMKLELYIREKQSKQFFDSHY